MKIKKLLSLLFYSSLITSGFCSCSYFDLDSPQNATETEISKEEQLLSSAMESYQNQVYSIAKKSFEEFKERFPTSYHLPLDELKIADCNFYLEEYKEAAEGYESFIRNRPKHEAVAYASYQDALSHYRMYRGSSKDQMPIKTALEKFSQFTKDFPKSEYTPEAQKNITEGKEKLAEHELSVAEFYSRQSQNKAAFSRLKNLYNNYPSSKTAQISPEILATTFSLDENQLEELFPLEVSQKEIIRENNLDSNKISAQGSWIRLVCEENQGKVIVQAFTSNDLRLASDSPSTGTRTLLLEANSPVRINSDTSCELPDLIVKLIKKNNKMGIVITGESSAALKLLHFNRPKRFSLISQ